MIQVKIIEAEHEEDCMEEANQFLYSLDESQIKQIQYSSSHFQSGEDQIFSFSICIIYCIDDDF